MKPQKITGFRREKPPLERRQIKENTCFSEGVASHAFAGICAVLWLMAILEITCGSLSDIFHAKSFGEILNLFLEHKAAYLPAVHEVYGENGGILLPALTLILTVGLIAFCFYSALRGSEKRFFAIFGIFSLPMIAMQLWMPSISESAELTNITDIYSMTGAYFALVAVAGLFRAFGKSYKRAVGFLCILVLAGGTFLAAFDTLGGQKAAMNLRNKIDSRMEEWIYGGAASGLTFGKFYGDELSERNLAAESARTDDAEDHVLLRVTMSDPSPYYLRGYTGDIYTKEGWRSAAEITNRGTKEASAENALFYELEARDFSTNTMLAEAAEAAGADLTGAEENVIQVVNSGASRRYLYLPYESIQIEAMGKALMGGGFLPDKTSASRYGVTAMPYMTHRYGEILNALSADTEKIEEYRLSESNYHDYVVKQDTEIPRECYGAIEELFPEPESIGTRGEAKTAILKTLGGLSYDENVTDSPEKEDFIGEFLERKSGYDKHFAAAAVMAFRYYGIPARFAEGYLITADMAGNVKAGEEITVTAAQAHCWAEYYEEGVGWLPFETTPTYIGLMKSAGNIRIKKDTKTRTEEEEKPEKSQNRQQTVTTESEVNYQTLAAFILLLLLLVASVIFGIRKIKGKKQRTAGVTPRPGDINSQDRRKAIMALMYFIRRAEKKGKNMGRAEKTERAERTAGMDRQGRNDKADRKEEPGERKEIEDIYLRTRYSHHEIREEDYQKMLEYYRKLRRRR